MNEHRRSEDADGETLLPRASGRDEEERSANASNVNVVRDDDDGVDDAGARAATTLATEDARDELEREMDHVVSGVGDEVESSVPTAMRKRLPCLLREIARCSGHHRGGSSGCDMVRDATRRTPLPGVETTACDP